MRAETVGRVGRVVFGAGAGAGAGAALTTVTYTSVCQNRIVKGV